VTGPLAEQVRERLSGTRPVAVTGQLTRVLGLEAEARGVHAAVGDLVQVSANGQWREAEVVAVRTDSVQLAPLVSLDGVLPGAMVRPSGARLQIAVGPGLEGRVLDALGHPIDGLGPIVGQLVPVMSPAPQALSRRRISEPLSLGVRVLDTMLATAAGQRVGVFAGSGVGKSTLLGMMARGTHAPRVVIGLIGERGREVREFLEDELGPEGRERAVTVVATADASPLMRLKAAHTATRIAEYYRDMGEDVLLLVDSLTRFAFAAREIGLASGEPPATRGYPPSVMSELARLLERAGPGPTGTITGLYTVLVEGDDMNDPVADAARSILDGHIVLSRRLAAAGHYPTVDVLESASRLASKVTSREQRDLVGRLRAMLAAYAEARDLVEIGAYAPGSNPIVDEALARKPAIDAFLCQDVSEVADAADSWERLAQVLA
jgi:flagellum-specific ATP synthase